jgi:hypothetical protein
MLVQTMMQTMGDGGVHDIGHLAKKNPTLHVFHVHPFVPTCTHV